MSHARDRYIPVKLWSVLGSQNFGRPHIAVFVVSHVVWNVVVFGCTFRVDCTSVFVANPP